MAIVSTPFAEQDRPLNANSAGVPLTGYDTLITATGGSGTFLPGETIVQAISGARGVFVFAQGNNLFVSQVGSTAFTTTASHTLTGLRSAATRNNPSAVSAVSATTQPNLLSGVVAEEFGFGPLRLTQFRFTNAPIVMARNGTTSAWGTQPLYAFPQGYIATLGGFGRLTATRGETTNMTANATFLYSVGSAAAVAGTAATGANSTISNIFNQVSQQLASGTVTFNLLSSVVTALSYAQGTATDTIPTIATPTALEVQNAVRCLSDKINQVRGNMIGGTLLDGTATPALANLNITNSNGTDAQIATGNSSLLISGTLNMLWANLGNLNNNA